MPIEIERKFLVLGDEWRISVVGYHRLRQGYLSKTADGSVRVRRCDAEATVTIKGPRLGIARQEFEYPIPLDQADTMLRDLCAKPLIEKVRYRVEHAGMTWEVDEYGGPASGLVLAEIELVRADQAFAAPRWIGAEVTHDPRYGGAAIANWSTSRVNGARAPSRRRFTDRPAGAEAPCVV